MPEPARVLIVDDSRIFRAALAEALTGQEGIVVVGSVFSGEKALEFLRSTPVDVVTLDVEMPGLNGLQTLEAIQRLNATRAPAAEIGAIMVSSFTRRGADVTVRALQAGAFDFATKPSGPSADANLEELRRQLTGQIRLFMARTRGKRAVGCDARQAPVGGESRTPRRTPPPTRAARAILIASSTGGPQALNALLPDLCTRVALPVVIVQHMPPPFTRSLADSLARRLGTTVVEASDGDLVRSGAVYIAPGGRHLVLRAQGGRLLTGLNDQPAENHCRPSADVLFRSAAAALSGEAIAVVLTGMDCDGTAGLRPLKRAGAYVIAQDEATSVVWGMPGNVVRAGLADEVLPLGEIAAAVQSLVGVRGAH
jgi:two-component system, chemotaxis family, protein-glutamate methylesterase/glutaminase